MLSDAMAAAGYPLAEIIDSYNKGIALDRRNYNAYMQKARFLLANFAYPEVIETLDAAAKISSNAQLFELKAWAYLEMGKRNLARKSLKKMVKQVISKSLIEKSVLIQLYIDKKYSGLIERLKKHKSLSDDMTYLKGLTYRRLGFFKSAFKTFRNLEDNTDFNWRVRIQQARMIRSRKQYAQAMDQFEQLLRHNDRAAFLWFEASLVHESQSQSIEGLKKIHTAISLSPDKLTYQLVGARLLEQSGNYREAIQNLRAILEIKPRYVRALKQLAGILTKTGDLERLTETYQTLLVINPGDYDAMLDLAVIYASADNISRARDTLQTLLAEKPDHLQARYLLAEIFYTDAMYSESLLQLTKLLKLDASHTEAKLLREKILSNKGEDSEALHS